MGIGGDGHQKNGIGWIVAQSAGIDTFAPLISALIGAMATGLWNKFSNRRADMGVRRQIQGYTGAIFSDLGILANSMKVSSRSTLTYRMEALIERSGNADVAVALKPRQAEALYAAVNWLVSLRWWLPDDVTSSGRWLDLNEAATYTVECCVSSMARVLITFGDDVTVASLAPEAVRKSAAWTTYVLEPSIIDRANFLRPLANWSARRNLWAPFK